MTPKFFDPINRCSGVGRPQLPTKPPIEKSRRSDGERPRFLGGFGVPVLLRLRTPSSGSPGGPLILVGDVGVYGDRTRPVVVTDDIPDPVLLMVQESRGQDP